MLDPLFRHLFGLGCYVWLCRGFNQLDHIYDSYPTKSSLPDSVPLSPHPQFVYNHSANVTAILHKTAHLNCRVKGVGNKTVTWVRHRDTHLLTAGRYTYTSDQRFRAIHQVLSEDYMLEISTVKAADGGLYECQISTTPVMSHYVYLQVSDPQTTILHGPDIYFEEGDTMNITCLVKDSPEPPQFLFWYHEEQTISYSSPRGGISQITEKGDITASFLLIQKARVTDAGLYSCKPSIGNIASASVHIVRSQDPAHWVTSSSASMAKSHTRNVLSGLLLVALSTILVPF